MSPSQNHLEYVDLFLRVKDRQVLEEAVSKYRSSEGKPPSKTIHHFESEQFCLLSRLSGSGVQETFVKWECFVELFGFWNEHTNE